MASVSAEPLQAVSPVWKRLPFCWLTPARFVLVILAFLLGLTTARNADVWAHLAAGRAVVAPAVGEAARVNYLSWLADLGMYGVYSLLGGPGLVLAKAALIGGVAAVMLGTRPDWKALLGVFLAMVALGGWLPLSPVCLSYLFLAATVSAVFRDSTFEKQKGWLGQLRSHKFLLLGFFVWANSDVNVLIGLALIGLHALAQSLAQVFGKETVAREPWQLLALLAAVTLFSPLPWSPTVLLRDLQLLTYPEPSLSPFRRIIFTMVFQGEIEGQVPVLAFWLFLVLLTTSFAVATRFGPDSLRRESLSWLWPCVLLFVGVVFWIRFLPFFLVAAGVISSRNFSLLPSDSFELTSAPTARRWTGVERLRFAVQLVLFVFTTLILLPSSWAGWLQPKPVERRNWVVEADPSLVRAAEVIRDWQATGQLGTGTEILFVSTDAVNTFAWFAPEAVGPDTPAGGGPHQAPKVRLALTSDPGAQELLGDPKTACVVLYDNNRSLFSSTLRTMTSMAGWTLAHFRGRVAVFVREGLPAAKPVSFAARAFGVDGADQAAFGGEEAFAPGWHWSDPFVRPRPTRSLDRDEAVSYLLLEEATRLHRKHEGAGRFLATIGASVVGNPTPFPAALPFDPRVLLLRQAVNFTGGGQELVASPVLQLAGFLILSETTADHYLSVRAARRGVVASPNDAAAFEALGEAYLNLLGDPLESVWAEAFPTLKRLRQIQAAAAFGRAVEIDPARPISHLGLGMLFAQKQYFDLAASEYRAAERYAGFQGVTLSITAEVVDKFELAADKARQTTEANWANLNVLDRARLAARNGLAGLALETLLRADVAEFGAAGVDMELNLLLSVGRVAEARRWLTPEQRNMIGGPAYDWLVFQSAVAVGDGPGASEALRRQLGAGTPGDALLAGRDVLEGLRLAASEVLNSRQNPARMTVAFTTSLVNSLAASGRKYTQDLQSNSEKQLLLGWVALEQGDMRACNEELNRNLAFWERFARHDVFIPSASRTISRQMASLIVHPGGRMPEKK